MDLPLLLSGFSSLLTAFVVGAVWATRRPSSDLATSEADVILLDVPAHGADDLAPTYRATGAR
jgi:hypothetical protein